MMPALLNERRSRRGIMRLLLATPLALAGCSRDDHDLVGTSLDSVPSPDFALVDHRGEPIQLSALAGRVVVLAFIYTNCPDICPAIAVSLRSTYDVLSEELRERIALLAVTVDPERDTPEALTDFSAKFGLDAIPQWHALTGSRPDLEAVWRAYSIDPGAIAEEVEAHLSGGGRPYLLSHTDALYLIDPKGRQRVLMRSNLVPKDLAGNIEDLAG